VRCFVFVRVCVCCVCVSFDVCCVVLNVKWRGLKENALPIDGVISIQPCMCSQPLKSGRTTVERRQTTAGSASERKRALKDDKEQQFSIERKKRHN
jgi:hypothetical protein